MPTPGQRFWTYSRNTAGALFTLLLLAGVAPTRGEAQEKVYSPGELSEMASLKSKEAAAEAIRDSYPKELERQGMGGKVQVQFVVRPDGTVDPNTVQILATSLAALSDAAHQAVVGLRFNPGKLNSQPVASKVMMPIVYAAR